MIDVMSYTFTATARSCLLEGSQSLNFSLQRIFISTVMNMETSIHMSQFKQCY